MLFWILSAALALAVASLLVLALVRGRGARSAVADAEADLAVYRDQLREVERDLARGVLSEAEAERARVEVSRRLLEADRVARHGAEPRQGPSTATAVAAMLAALAVVAGSIGLYAWLGRPGTPDLPLAERIAASEAARAARPSQAEAEARAPKIEVAPVEEAYAELVTRLRAVVAERPDDLQGQELLAQAEARMGDFAAAARAEGRVLALKGDGASSTEWSDYADLLVLAAGGSYVSPEAEAALTEALRRDPRNPVARYYSGLLFIQTGRPDLAFRLWAPLLAESAEDDPWVPPIRESIEELAALAGVTRYTPPPPRAAKGPSAADVAAAEEMTPEERTAMIEGMVDGLAERLASEGGPAEDWARLIGALGVLGRNEQAREILAEARGRFQGDAAGLDAIEAAARRAGIEP